jgi:hypothetical protein
MTSVEGLRTWEEHFSTFNDPSHETTLRNIVGQKNEGMLEHWSKVCNSCELLLRGMLFVILFFFGWGGGFNFKRLSSIQLRNIIRNFLSTDGLFCSSAGYS